MSGFCTTAAALHWYPCSTLQVLEQPSPETVLPPSHSWPAATSTGRSSPSPQAVLQAPPALGQTGSFRQKGEHPSAVSLLPSSHCSDPSSVPLPQVVRVQGWPAVGHCQPSRSVMAGSSRRQVGLQP